MSNAETDDPRRTKLRTDKELPICKKFMRDMEYTEPTRTKPIAETADPMRT